MPYVEVNAAEGHEAVHRISHLKLASSFRTGACESQKCGVRDMFTMPNARPTVGLRITGRAKIRFVM